MTCFAYGTILSQASLTDKGKDLSSSSAEADVSTSDEVDPHRKDAVEAVAARISSMGISGSHLSMDPTMGSAENSIPESGPLDIDKKIRALKKKVPFACVLFYRIMCATKRGSAELFDCNCEFLGNT